MAKKTTKKTKKFNGNREAWLNAVATAMEPSFKSAGIPLDKYRATCGFPCTGARAKKARRIGECHSTQMSKDGNAEIFVHPQLDNSLEVAGVLVHELLHAAVGVAAGHKGPFKAGMKKIGLEGKPTQAMPGDELNVQLEGIIAKLGVYPHQSLGVNEDRKKQTTRLIKVECVCGCVVRMSNKWIEEAGCPTCGCGEEMQEAN